MDDRIKQILQNRAEIYGGGAPVAKDFTVNNYGYMNFLTTSGTLVLGGTLVPDADPPYYLGSASKNFANAYVTTTGTLCNGL